MDKYQKLPFNYHEIDTVSLWNNVMSHVARKPVFRVFRPGLHNSLSVQQICAFVFAFAKSRFSHDVAHIITMATIPVYQYK